MHATTTQINTDTVLPADFTPVVEVRGPEEETHKIYADPIGSEFLTKILEQNRQMLTMLSNHAELFDQLRPHIQQLTVSDNPTPEERTTINNHIRDMLEIFANFSRENA